MNRSPFGWMLAAGFTAVLMTASPAAAQDADCDGIADASDNCPDRFNPTQSDIDGDLAGDRCDADKDGDGADNDADNCPKDANGGQEDADSDGVGDACDQCAEAPDDVVNRHGCTIHQLCPCDGPEDDQSWRNHDQYVRCVKKKARNFRIKELITSDERREIIIAAKENSCGTPLPGEGDNDGDGVSNASDNCASDSNPSQRNTDGDAFGDACDTDKDDDRVLNAADNCPLGSNASGQGDDADGDGAGDACDVCADSDGGEVVDRDGCGLDQHCPCDVDAEGNPWASYLRYLRCYFDEVFRFKLLGLINKDEAEALKTLARESECGERAPVCE